MLNFTQFGYISFLLLDGLRSSPISDIWVFFSSSSLLWRFALTVYYWIITSIYCLLYTIARWYTWNSEQCAYKIQCDVICRRFLSFVFNTLLPFDVYSFIHIIRPFFRIQNKNLFLSTMLQRSVFLFIVYFETTQPNRNHFWPCAVSAYQCLRHMRERRERRTMKAKRMKKKRSLFLFLYLCRFYLNFPPKIPHKISYMHRFRKRKYYWYAHRCHFEKCSYIMGWKNRR